MLVLEVLGTLSLRNETPPVPVSAQQKRSLGLLAILALAGRQGFPRDRIEAYLWPESSAPLARHSLDQTVYAIRHALGSDFILSSGRELRLNPDLVQVDAWEFEEAIRARQWAAAVERYKGTLLDGFHFTDSREAESWIDAERARLLREYQKAVEFLANAAAESGDHARSVTWWRRLANSDPLSASATKHLMMALAAADDRAGAVKQARLYQELVRQELEIEPDAEIERLAATLSNHVITEIAVAGVRKEPSHDRLASAAGSHDAPPNRSPALSVAAPTVKGKDGSRRDRPLLYAVIPLAILMTAAAIWGWMRPGTSKPVVRYRLVVDSTEAIAKGSSWSGRIALSPDGSRLAYIGGPRSQLLIRSRDQLHAIAIPGTEGVTNPFFSPDGKHVGFLEGEGVRIASIDGGPSITLTQGGPSVTVNDTLTGLAGASWGADGMIYADNDGSAGLVRVEAKAGAIPSRFTTLDTANSEFDHTWPDVLPNGKGVLFAVTYSGKKGVKGRFSYAIAVAEIPSGKHRVIVQDATYARYASSGHLLYVTADKRLMAVPFDQNSMTVTGEPIALSEGIRAGVGGSADLAISATGTLVYSTGEETGRQELVWVTRAGKAEPIDPQWSGEYLGSPRLSPDGKRLAVTRSANAEPWKIWIKRLDRGPSIRLAGDGKENYFPAWSPDGRSVTFTSNPTKGSSYLGIERADGGAPGAVQLRRTGNLFNAGWSPDGKWLIFTTDIAAPGAGDILAMRPGVDTAPIPVVATAFTETSPAISPNGRWLAYSSNESGKNDIYVVPFPNTRGGKWAISTDGGTEPVWSHRGKELLYRDASGNLVAVGVNADLTFSVGRSRVLFPAAGYASLRFTPQYAVARDDRRFLMIRPLETRSPDNIIVVENWFEELKAKFPRK
jgi:DNA-binding SARP family transcriptional activator/Tol biopolymer transport system component